MLRPRTATCLADNLMMVIIISYFKALKYNSFLLDIWAVVLIILTTDIAVSI
jgi:hypothetical protein